MKKLLGLLAATGLVASSTISVVACGKKPGVSTDDSVLTTKLLIDEFINEIGSTIYTHLDSESVTANLMREIKTGVVVNDFFNKENIQKYGIDNNNLEGTVTPLGDGEKTKINEAFHNLVETKSLEAKINKLATDTDKYSILINGGVVVKDIVFDINSFEMNYVVKDKFVANASIRMVVNFTYIDYNQTVVSGNVSNTISLRVTDDSVIIAGVTDLEKNLAKDLLNKDSAAVWNKATDRGYTQADLYKAFELYNDQKRKTKLNEIMSEDSWEGILNDFIVEQNYFEDNQNSKVKLDFSAKQIKSDKIINKIEPVTYGKPSAFYGNSFSLRKTILQKYQANDDLNLISGAAKGDQEIYDILNGSFKDTYSNFKTSMQTNIPDYAGTNLGKDNILLGETVIAGLALNFENLNFVLPLNTLRLSYSFSLTGKDFDIETNSTLDKSELGEAIYKNTEAGIKSFQENFGINNSDAARYLNTIYTKYDELGNLTTNFIATRVRVPLLFSGTNNQKPLSVNIFDELGSEFRIESSNSGAAKLNSVLSLETNNLSAVRYNLLNDGFQGNFSFKVAQNIKILGNNGSTNVLAPINTAKTAISFQKSEENKFMVSSYGYSGDGGNPNYIATSLGFQLDLNLISVFIDLTEFYVRIDNNVKDLEYKYDDYRIQFKEALFMKG